MNKYLLSVEYQKPSISDFHKEWIGFPKLISPKAKASKSLFGPFKLTNPSQLMAYKVQSSFGITAILYTYRACKTLFVPIKPTNQSVWMAYKGQSRFGKLEWMLRMSLHVGPAVSEVSVMIVLDLGGGNTVVLHPRLPNPCSVTL